MPKAPPPRPPRSRPSRGPRPDGGKGPARPRPEGSKGPARPRPEGSKGPARPRPEGGKGKAPTRVRSTSKAPARPRPEHRERPERALPPRIELGTAQLFPLPAAGTWIYLCREGFELDLAEELIAASKSRPKPLEPKLLQPALLATAGAPPRGGGRIDLVFARQAFPVGGHAVGESTEELSLRTMDALKPLLGTKHPFVVHVFVPDSDLANPHSHAAAALETALLARLDKDPALAARRAHDPRATGGLLVHVCLVEPGIALVGVQPAAEALSSRPGGRARMGVAKDAPSRAAMKLEEALEWLGVGPEPGDRAIDLGAAPGGWTYLLAERRCTVIAVDLGRLRPDIAARRNVAYVKASAFDFAPEEPVDWLFCDMAWRPLEVAAMLARWGRSKWARTLVANIKLPMKRKVEFLPRIREIIESGGWRDLRMRHLYHDRDEITLTAWSR